MEKGYLLFSFLFPFDLGDVSGDRGLLPVLIIHSGSADVLFLFFDMVIVEMALVSLNHTMYYLWLRVCCLLSY